MDKPSLNELLRDLLVHTYDSYKGYHEAADQIEGSNPSLAHYFQARSLERYQFVQYLYDHVGSGSKIEITQIDDSLEGDIHRIWMRIRSLLNRNDTQALLSECIRGEKVLQTSYENVLANDRIDLATTLTQMLEAQIRIVKKNIHEIQVMHDMADND